MIYNLQLKTLTKEELQTLSKYLNQPEFSLLSSVCSAKQQELKDRAIARKASGDNYSDKDVQSIGYDQGVYNTSVAVANLANDINEYIATLKKLTSENN